ncbi:MAG: protein translocase subunit SecD [Planctomycetota bacterium]|jgi:SecD/SecF fusion protein|nr:protein translocase subunit SecD [Planctomycetota bacterium]
MFNYFYAQIVVVALMVIGCAVLMVRSKVSLSKILVAVGITIICVLELLNTPLQKRIVRLEDQIANAEKYTPYDPGLPGLRKSLDDARRLYGEVKSDPRRWPERLPFNLGLDLRGGTEIRLALRLDPARISRIQGELDRLQTLSAEEAAAGNAEAARDIEQQMAAMRDRLQNERFQIDQDLANAVDVVRRRLNNSGLAEIPVTREGDDKILVQLPGMDQSQAQDALDVIQKQGALEFRMVVSENDENWGRLVTRIRQMNLTEEKYNIHEQTLESVAPELVGEDGRCTTDGAMLFDWLKEPDEIGPGGGVTPRTFELVSKAVEMRGDSIASARAEPDPARAAWRITLAFDTAGASEFEQVTARNIGKRLGIVLDGQLQSAPVIQSRISGGNAEISGNFDQHSAQQLDVVLKSGSLKVKIEKEYDNTVGATLGEDSIRAGVRAMLIGAALVIIFMAFYYLMAGLVTDVVLVLNILMIMAILSAFGATMTLSGFAGLVLTIGMAVDANVLIFERIREERERGNPLQRAIDIGYERAFTTIIDSNLTTILTALILHHFGTEQVKGFALTLIIGLVASMFCSLVVTRWVFDLLLEYKRITDLKMRRMFHNAKFDFVGIRRPVIVVSFLIILALLILTAYRGERNLGQDFTGGVLANIVPEKPMTMAEAREAAGAGLADFPDARDTLQSYGAADAEDRYSEFVVRTKMVELDADALEEAKKAGIPKFTAENFRSALAGAFNLVPEGFSVQGRHDDVKLDNATAYTVRLSLQQPKTPAELSKLLVDQPLVMPVFVGPADSRPEIADGGIANPIAQADTPVREFAIVMSVPNADAAGVLRDPMAQAGTIREALQDLRRGKAIDFTDPFPRFTSVGRTVARTMEANALMAIVFSAIGIFIYIWLRFNFRVGFGVGTIISLLHDTLFVIGALALVDQLGIMNGQIDLTVMAAILTVMGYSLNDTIVVLDRIREHIGDSEHPTDETINTAINETLSRTVITSLTTLLVVIALLIWGGDVMRGFSFTLLVGVIVGTFSSIFIASPILVEFAHWKRNREKRNLDRRTSANPGNKQPGTAAAK